MSDGTTPSAENAPEGMIYCTYHERHEPPMEAPPPVSKAMQERLLEHVCADAWAEWQRMEVMVINELRLNFMDPEAQKVLDEHMARFLRLPGAGEHQKIPGIPDDPENPDGPPPNV